ncbi:MAG: hybrid sensor histidine kinase/response regulator, partial [Parachlamydiales bacterium]|nr:hybrid sensor histidine kinase/response regulator [Parachlamydiales bacterium]
GNKMASVSGRCTPVYDLGAPAEEKSPPRHAIGLSSGRSPVVSPGGFHRPGVLTESSYSKTDAFHQALFYGVLGLDTGIIFLNDSDKTLHFVNGKALEMLRGKGFDVKEKPIKTLKELVKGIKLDQYGEVQRIEGLRIKVFPPDKPFDSLQKVEINPDEDKEEMRKFAHDINTAAAAAGGHISAQRYDEASRCVEAISDMVLSELNPSLADRPFTVEELAQWVNSQVDGLNPEIKINYELGSIPKELQFFGPKAVLGKMLVNLIKNAKNHAFKGVESSDKKITVRIKLSRSELDMSVGGKLCFEVEDNGKGIAPEIRDRLGVSGASTAIAGGKNFGLGMASCFNEAKKIGANFYPVKTKTQDECSAAESPGTTFSFDLEIKFNKVEKIEQPPTPLSEERVLVIEDSQLIRMATSRLLKRKGYQHVDVSDNYGELITMIERAQYTKIFLDDGLSSLAGLPEERKHLEGINLIPVIRESYQRHGKGLPDIILFSSGPSEALVRKYALAGVKFIVDKPFKVDSPIRSTPDYTRNLEDAGPAGE